HIVFAAFARAAQDCANAGHQFTRIKRLGKIIVGADLKSHDAIHILAARGEEEHRNTRAVPDAAQHIKTIQTWKHDIEHDQKVIAGHGASEPRLSVMHGLYLKAFRRQVFADQRAKLNVIVDDQNAFHVIHSSSSTHNT